MRAISEEKQKQILELLRKGNKVKEIAKIVGCSEPTVRRYRKASNIQNKQDSKQDSSFPAIPHHSISVLNERKVINPLDIARDFYDVAEFGSSAGIVVGGAIKDLSDAFNRDIPYMKRIAKGMRGASAIISLLISAQEAYNQLTEKKREEQRMEGEK